jgi:hypothetical protein
MRADTVNDVRTTQQRRGAFDAAQNYRWAEGNDRDHQRDVEACGDGGHSADARWEPFANTMPDSFSVTLSMYYQRKIRHEYVRLLCPICLAVRFSRMSNPRWWRFSNGFLLA